MIYQRSERNVYSSMNCFKVIAVPLKIRYKRLWLGKFVQWIFFRDNETI